MVRSLLNTLSAAISIRHSAPRSIIAVAALIPAARAAGNEAMGKHSAAKMYAGVTIEGSSVTLAIPDLLSSEEVTVECTFADGALTAIVPSESEYIDDMAFTIQLLEDGSMSIATSFLDEPMVFYMTAEAIQE